MRMKKLMLLASFAVLMVLATGCGSAANSEADGGSGSKDTEKLSGKLVVGGSSALQPLAAAAAKGFMEEHPEVQIQVQGGGSGTGLSQVAKGNLDIGMSDYFAESGDGIDANSLVDNKVAVVGMTAAVSPKAGVTKLSKEDLKKVFTGKVKNWSELGGKDEKITLVNRPDGSGTRATFGQFALDNETPAEGITEDSSNTVKKIVSETSGAIGYLAFSYFNDDSVTKLAINGAEATDENVTNGKFPVWAYEHMYTKGTPSKLEKAFLDYMMGDKVQGELVPSQGYISVSKMEVERDANGKTTKKSDTDID
ncbi:phosphate ABC transporter substrate-binding protein [Scopulibacillus darangshiensis]